MAGSPSFYYFPFISPSPTSIWSPSQSCLLWWGGYLIWFLIRHSSESIFIIYPSQCTLVFNQFDLTLVETFPEYEYVISNSNCKFMNLSLRGISNNTFSQFDFWHEIQKSLTDASTDLMFVCWRLSSGPNLYNMSIETPHLVTLPLSTVLLLLQRFIKTRGHKRIINSNSKLSQSMTLSRIPLQLSFHSFKYLLFQTQCLCIKWVVLLLDVFATF